MAEPYSTKIGDRVLIPALAVNHRDNFDAENYGHEIACKLAVGILNDDVAPVWVPEELIVPVSLTSYLDACSWRDLGGALVRKARARLWP